MSSRLLAVAGVVMVGWLSATSVEAAPPAGQYLLRYKFLQGQEIRYEVSTAMEITTQVGSVADTAWNKSESSRHYRVVASDSQAGTGSLELTIDRVKMSAQSSSTSPLEEFQSDDPAHQPPRYKHILARVGKPQATVNVTTTGQSVKVVPNPQAAVEANKPVAVGAADASPENYLSPLPEQPVAVGDEWKERFEVAALNDQRLTLQITLLRKFHLVEVKEGKATIKFQTTILTPVHDPSVSAQLIQRETSGTFVFDLDQGIILSRVATADRTVVDAFGAKSSLRCVGRYHERLAPTGSLVQSPRDGATRR